MNADPHARRPTGEATANQSPTDGPTPPTDNAAWSRHLLASHPLTEANDASWPSWSEVQEGKPLSEPAPSATPSKPIEGAPNSPTAASSESARRSSKSSAARSPYDFSPAAASRGRRPRPRWRRTGLAAAAALIAVVGLSVLSATSEDPVDTTVGAETRVEVDIVQPSSPSGGVAVDPPPLDDQVSVRLRNVNSDWGFPDQPFPEGIATAAGDVYGVRYLPHIVAYRHRSTSANALATAVEQAQHANNREWERSPVFSNDTGDLLVELTSQSGRTEHLLSEAFATLCTEWRPPGRTHGVDCTTATGTNLVLQSLATTEGTEWGDLADLPMAAIMSHATPESRPAGAGETMLPPSMKIPPAARSALLADETHAVCLEFPVDALRDLAARVDAAEAEAADAAAGSGAEDSNTDASDATTPPRSWVFADHEGETFFVSGWQLVPGAPTCADVPVIDTVEIDLQ